MADFGRSVNLISTREVRICPPNDIGTPGFSDLPTALRCDKFVTGTYLQSNEFSLFLQIDVSQFLTPSFHPTFLGVLRILSEQDTEVKQQRAFKRFVRDYGTHYLSSAFLGKNTRLKTLSVQYAALMSLVSHKKSYLVCVESTNLRTQPIPIFFQSTKLRQPKQVLENK